MVNSYRRFGVGHCLHLRGSLLRSTKYRRRDQVEEVRGVWHGGGGEGERIGCRVLVLVGILKERHQFGNVGVDVLIWVLNK